MKRLFFIVILFLTFIIVGLAFAQTTSDSFAELQTLGEPRPRGLQYDVNFDRIVWVDALGRLQLVDAQTFEVQHTLYATGFYNAYEFSHNGRYLALAIDTRFEIYDTETGELLLTFAPDGALVAEGTLYWSNDDTLLGVNLQVRAPQAIRRSENDTTNLPYVWDIASELGERRTILPGARAIPFFDYRNGFVYGANNKAIVGLPERLQILDITPDGVDVVAEFTANRFEPDPIFAWQSLRDDLMYLRPNPNSSEIIQFDTTTSEFVRLPIGRDINVYGFDSLEGLQRSHLSGVIGDPFTTQENSLLRYLLGTDYQAQFGYHPITVTLVDYLEPATPDTGNQVAILLYIFDETRGVGRFDLINAYPNTGFSLSQDGTQLAIRRDDANAQIDVYEVSSGNVTQIFMPTMPEIARNGVFSFDTSGETIISDFQRFDVSSGEIVFDNLHYNEGYDNFFWDGSSERLVTITGNRWWVWDVHTGEVLRQEELRLGSDVIGTSDDGERYLVSVAEEQNEFGIGTTYEMVEVGMDDRVRVSFADLPNVSIENVIFSPNGQDYIVIYSVNGNGQHAPANEIMLYNLDMGLLWHMAGDDLPYMTSRQYGWVDDDTVYIYSEEGVSAPERIYGVDYHASGIPQCLADEFPEEIGRWSLIWERLNNRLASDDLNRLSQATCNLLPSDEAEVLDFIFPSATPTRLPVTATPSTIAGVPICLTNRFPDESRDYAVIWQELINGRSDAEIEELELLLCENLSGSASPQGEARLITDNVAVMLINVRTGRREVGAFIPEIDEPLPPNIDLINSAFRQQYGFTPYGELSPNLALYAVRNQRNQLTIYRLLTPYATYSADATATVAIAQEQVEEETFLSLRPTATQGFEFLGEPRPTFTPTVTPTSPPRPDGESYLVQDEETERICPFDTRFSLDNLPADFEASGQIITINNGVLDIATGTYTYQDELPLCYAEGNCNFTFDNSWIYYQSDTPELIISRPDGSQAQTVFYDNQLPTVSNIAWRGNFLEYNLTLPASSERRRETTVTERYDPLTQTRSNALSYLRRQDYNQLPTTIILEQSGMNNRYQVATVSFSSSSGTGQRYFIYDRQDRDYRYFGRLSNTAQNGHMIFSWHPLGDVMYYSYPDDPQTYAFFPETETFALYGDVPTGEWSNDAQYKVYGLSLLGDEREDLIENGQPVPNIEIWDSATGVRRQYCVPGYEEVDIQASMIWSPDNRYLAFRSRLPENRQFSASPIPTFILDTQTGSMTEISDVARELIVWVGEASE
ncbi:MAG: hypothetical protein Phog2KO_21670 [Phototrophicaceae bacterium]